MGRLTLFTGTFLPQSTKAGYREGRCSEGRTARVEPRSLTCRSGCSSTVQLRWLRFVPDFGFLATCGTMRELSIGPTCIDDRHNEQPSTCASIGGNSWLPSRIRL